MVKHGLFVTLCELLNCLNIVRLSKLVSLVYLELLLLGMFYKLLKPVLSNSLAMHLRHFVDLLHLLALLWWSLNKLLLGFLLSIMAAAGPLELRPLL